MSLASAARLSLSKPDSVGVVSVGFCLLHKRALVLDNLLAKTFLGLGRYFEGFQRNFEGSFTLCADANGWCGAQPLRYSKTEFRHGLLPRYSIAHTQP
jgi:hypothetical protein